MGRRRVAVMRARLGDSSSATRAAVPRVARTAAVVKVRVSAPADVVTSSGTDCQYLAYTFSVMRIADGRFASVRMFVVILPLYSEIANIGIKALHASSSSTSSRGYLPRRPALGRYW